jgi:uncharacterized protein
MLEMRDHGERCDRSLKPVGAAMICSYECTFCPHWWAEMDGVCPKCSGSLVVRPAPAVPAP